MSRSAFIYGYPIGHSISPAIHNAAFRSRGLDVQYSARQVTPDELPTAVAVLRAEATLGANITVPHKEAVLGLVDELDDVARLVGAANTIHNRAGRLYATNTDSDGFARSLQEANWDVAGGSVVLLGAGGAARAVADAVLRAGAGRLLIANRTLRRAERLGDELRAIFREPEVRAIGLADLDRPALRECDLLVNTTTVGMHGDESPLDASLLPDTAAVADIIYNPAVTPLLQQAGTRGLPTLNGLPMLVYQAAAAWKIWTGQPAPVEVMFEAARAALAETTRPRADRP